MQSVKEAAAAFMANKRVAVTGMSRRPKDHGSNTVYKRGIVKFCGSKVLA
jgi:uncharacterized protein